MLRILLLALLLPAAAAAGPWPQEKGAVYLFAGAARDRHGDWTTLYGEVGLGGDLTLAFETGGRPLPKEETDRQVGALLWHPILPGDGPWRLAGALGVHADLATPEMRPRARGALAAGRGFSTPWGGAWTTLEVSATAGRRLRAHGLIGLRPSDRDAYEIGLVATQEDGEADVAALPVWERALTDRLALRTGLSLSKDATGVSIGFAARF